MYDKKSLKEFGKAMRAARKELGLTQHQLAECLGCTSQCISCWEIGKFFPTANFSPMIAKDLGISVEKYKLKVKKLIEKQKEAIKEESKVEDKPVTDERDDIHRIPVYVGRVLETLEEYGYSTVQPSLILGLMANFAKVIVGRRHYEDCGDKSRLSIPILIPADIGGAESPVYIYNGGKGIEFSKDILTFDWDGYLKNEHIEPYLVFNKDEETDFFQE